LLTKRSVLPAMLLAAAMAILCWSAALAEETPPAGTDGSAAAKSGDQPAKTAGNTLDIEVADGGVRVYAINADAHELFTELAEKADLQLVVDDTVKRKLTVNLSGKTAREAIDYIVSAYGFSFAEVEGVLLISEGIPKNPSSYLLSSIDSITAKYVQAPQAKSLLPVFLQDHVKINPGQNAVVLSAPRAVLDKFTDDIRKFDQPAAQITLDVLVVELTDTKLDEFAASINWAHAGKGAFTDSLLGLMGFDSITNLPPDFFVKLAALVSAGKARVRANPHIATVSGQSASVFIGQQKFLSTPVTLTGQGDYETSNSIDAGVRLAMWPLTGGQGEIIIGIDQEISTLSALDPTTGLPNKTTRSAQTTVRVKDGQTIVIGGLKQEETRAHRSRIPILGDIPILGQMFRSKRVDTVTTDLAIFITPRILTLTGHRPPDEEKALMEHFGVPPPSSPPAQTPPPAEGSKQ